MATELVDADLVIELQTKEKTPNRHKAPDIKKEK